MLALTKFSFYKEDWVIGSNSIKFKDLNLNLNLSRSATREATRLYHVYYW